MINLIMAGDINYNDHEKINRCLKNHQIVVSEYIQGYSGIQSAIKIIKPKLLLFFITRDFNQSLDLIEGLKLRFSIPVLFLIKSKDSKKIKNVLSTLNLDHIIINERQDDDCDIWINELIVKVKLLKISSKKNENVLSKRIINIIAIGASTGGTDAIYEIIKNIKKPCPPILIAIHMPSGFTKMYSHRLDECTDLEVKEARNGELIKENHVYVSPGGYHISINGNRIKCSKGNKINGYIPSIDLFFESVGDSFGKNAIGIILTGMGKDGSLGLFKMKSKGAITIGQDKKTSLIYGMPKEAFDIGAITYQVPLHEISSQIYKYI